MSKEVVALVYGHWFGVTTSLILVEGADFPPSGGAGSPSSSCCLSFPSVDVVFDALLGATVPFFMRKFNQTMFPNEVKFDHNRVMYKKVNKSTRMFDLVFHSLWVWLPSPSGVVLRCSPSMSVVLPFTVFEQRNKLRCKKKK